MTYTSEQIQKHGELILLWENSELKPKIECNFSWDNKWIPCEPVFDVHAEYRVKLKPSREEITAQWVKDNHLKVGDKVKVLKGFESEWAKFHQGDAGICIGNICEVIDVSEIFVSIEHKHDVWSFPVECLEKVKEEYVPFTFEDRALFQNKWVKQKDHNFEFLLIYVDVDGIDSNCNYHTYQKAFDRLEFIDGTPFGKKI